MEKIKIVLVDDHKIFRDGFRLLLQSFPMLKSLAKPQMERNFWI